MKMALSEHWSLIPDWCVHSSQVLVEVVFRAPLCLQVVQELLALLIRKKLLQTILMSTN